MNHATGYLRLSHVVNPGREGRERNGENEVIRDKRSLVGGAAAVVVVVQSESSDSSSVDKSSGSMAYARYIRSPDTASWCVPGATNTKPKNRKVRISAAETTQKYLFDFKKETKKS